MGERLIKPYEISVWEEQLTQIEGSNPAEYRIKETKLAIIGSDTMTGFNKIYDPVFTKKVNGERTLTFSLKYKYFDPYSEEQVINPFAALLINERKIKLYYEKEWYEFIIKEHNESSDELTWTYTCTDAFVLELSKNGYNIEFNSDLNNNLGTAGELTEKTLENTEWQFGGADPLKQYIEEPIYEGWLRSVDSINIIDTNTGSVVTDMLHDLQIYVFYSYVKNKDGKFVQFITRRDFQDYSIDEKNVITDINYRITNELIYDVKQVGNETVRGFWKVDNSNNYQLVIEIGEIERFYQANRVDYSPKTTYDPIMERTVQLYKTGDREVYKYTESLYTTSNVVQNFIVNGDNFNVLEDGTLQGWNPYVDSEDNESIEGLELVTYPELEYGKKLVDIDKLSTIDGYLKVNFIGAITDNYLNTIYNNGFESNLSFIESIAKGDEFLFRWRAGRGELGNLQPVQSLGLLVAKFNRDTPQRWGRYYYHIDSNDIVLNISGTPKVLNSIIEGGVLSEDNKNYLIDNVIQTPSTKYLYKSGDSYYYWDGTNSIFVLHSTIVDGQETVEPSSTFLPYYYLSDKATKAITSATLEDPTIKYGIFIYTTDSNINKETPVYLRDIQFTRCIKDANGIPVTLGNIPVATTFQKDCFYFKPSDGTAAEDIEIYTSPEELQAITGNEVKPIYNENSEKNLSISVSQSNCFNILQTIAETFECWIDLVVGHDSAGYITYTNDKPDKYVYLRQYAGKDNYTGFKYGINLQSIERTVNSDEIVTKLIVDQSQSDYVDEGYVSISNAPSNPSGEEYILNFEYYYNQGLLNRSIAEVDKKNFITEVAKFNSDLKELEKQRSNLEMAITTLGSSRNIFTELIDAAQDAQSEALEDFKSLSDGKTYDQYKDSYNPLVDDGTLPADKSELFEEENILEVLGKLYTSSATINNYTGILDNINFEYWEKRKQLKGSENHVVKIWTADDSNTQTHLFVELDDYWQGVSFTVSNDTTKIYNFTISNKYFDIPVNDDSTQWELTFTIPEGYTIETNPCIVRKNDVIRNKILSGTETLGVEKEIEQLLEQKKEFVNKFNNKYIRFISEGTWSSTDYIDSELYYIDALQASNTSAQPEISYTIKVIEVSQLEGLEYYNFDTGDKTYVEDTEFFGWTDKEGVRTPVKEEVFVSEVEWHLEEPENNTITIQNYKTRFEDLFQRVSATVQTVQYNETTYAKISSLMDANGKLNADVLVKSLQQIAGRKYNLTSDGSVLIDEDRILVQNLTNSQNLVIINSEGIRISSDGGATWTTAIDGRGINIGTVYTGKLNTDQVIIGSENNPSFRWDKSGISAYKSDAEIFVKTIDINIDPNKIYYEYDSISGEYVEVDSPIIDDIDNYYERQIGHDLKTFVRYDQYGLYGIKNSNTFKANSVQDVKDNAHFAVTWDGFFIKNSYEDGGRVSITSDNDFQVIDGNEIERVKIGSLGIVSVTSERIYGINISNKNGDSVLSTNNDGDLTIAGTIYANAGEIGGMSVDNTRLRMNHIILEPGVGIYSDWGETGVPPFIISDKDGNATFNNVIVRGSIKTSVFEYEEIQAVGGAFMFRPSTTIRTARKSGNDLILTVEKVLILRDGAWYKLSNYNEDSTVDAEELSTFGLSHIYQLSKQAIRDEEDNITGYELTLLGAAAILESVDINDLAGGSLIDMGYERETYRPIRLIEESNPSMLSLYELINNQYVKTTDTVVDISKTYYQEKYQNGINNYGIGINSSDNYINLPPRAISLFETVVNHAVDPKVSYRYRSILGTLPDERVNNLNVRSSIYPYMRGTQGIYTDNMYIGDGNQYIAFYEDDEGDKHLKISAKELIFEYDPNTGEEITWEDKINDVSQGADAIQVDIDSTAGILFVNDVITSTLICTVRKGGVDITNDPNYNIYYTWKKRLLDGSGYDPNWGRPLEHGNRIDITSQDVENKGVFECEVVIQEV